MTMRSTTGRSSRDLRDLADNMVKDRLGQVPGVAAVFIAGGDRREVRVALDRSRLDAYGITLSEVATAIRQQNLNVLSCASPKATATTPCALSANLPRWMRFGT